MSSAALTAHEEIVQTLSDNRAELLARDGISEDDVRAVLISPFLEYLGYPAAYRSSEQQDKRNRPDEIAWVGAVSLYGNRPSRIILEAKPLGTDFDRGAGRAETPARQLRRYLRDHSTSGLDTYGVLTDGVRYRISQRTGHREDVKHIGEWNILDGPTLDGASPIAEVFELLHRTDIAAIPQAQPEATPKARELARAIADGKEPHQLLNLISRGREQQPDIRAELTLTGKALDAARDDWESRAWRHGVALRTDNPDLEGSHPAVAVIKYAIPEPGTPEELTRSDVALAARTFARLAACRTSVVIAYQANADGLIERARAAVHHQGHTGMTPEFDPQNPPPSVLKSLEQLQKALLSPQPVRAERLTAAVTAQVIRNEFYQAVAGWTQARQQDRSPDERHTVLRHLIRTVFAWILQEAGLIPGEPFEERFAAQYGGGNYHAAILSFLFQQLNTPKPQRDPHPLAAVQEALADVPFLNGSLFAQHPGDETLALADSDYFGTDPQRPGLFTIMSRYRWTTAEHTPGESDQTIDPEMLSNLFENLVAATEFWIAHPERMPAGTYYTPSDVATEMVKDALAAAARRYAPPRITDAELRSLFGEAEPEISQIGTSETSRLRRGLRSLSIFDPSVGSGEFPLIAALALRTALTTLGDQDEDRQLTRRIIQEQLYAQDINPMATQVTRLWLFIAIMSAEKELTEINPLPNLEGRIVCADTLATVARPEWRPESTGGLEDADPETGSALTRLAEVRRRWLNAHTEAEKSAVRKADEAAREQLIQTLQRTNNAGQPEMSGFASYKLLEPGAAPAETDARLLFYAPDWTGFDIVIGNPPYESIAAGRNPAQRRAVRKRLSENKRYQTVGGGDLYNLFCEVSLTLVKPEDGVVTLVVPLSLSFGKDQAATRRLFQQRAKSIRLRHQDNGPDTTFHKSPVANPTNRQRTTIITAVTGKRRAAIETTGTGKWGKSEREQYLLSRRYTRIPASLPRLHPNLAHQWPRIPHESIAQLITAMQAQQRTISDLTGRGENEYAIAFPQTVYAFITAAPAGQLQRHEIIQRIAGEPELELAMAALNGHIAYAWWRVWGDAFHINDHEMSTVTIPDQWLDDAAVNAQARSLGRQLMAAITPENIDTNKSGTAGNSFENINFYKVCPDIIRQLDELHLTALGLPLQPLLPHLHKIRSGSNWRL